jgi:hypothetical protein
MQVQQSTLAYLALILTILGHIPSAGAQVPRREEWGERFNSAGAKLTDKEISRTTIQGRTVITYNLFASGLPKDQHYALCVLNVGSEPRAAADAYLNGEGKVVSTLADPGHGVVEDPINAKVFGGKGEPIQFALVSDDAKVRAFAEIIPFPVEQVAGPCHLSLIETGPYYYGVLIRVTGLEPEESLALDMRSETEGGESKAAADREGTYNAALLPFVKGKKAGKAHFTLTAKSCRIGIEFPWGEGSYTYQ